MVKLKNEDGSLKRWLIGALATAILAAAAAYTQDAIANAKKVPVLENRVEEIEKSQDKILKNLEKLNRKTDRLMWDRGMDPDKP